MNRRKNQTVVGKWIDENPNKALAAFMATLAVSLLLIMWVDHKMNNSLSPFGPWPSWSEMKKDMK